MTPSWPATARFGVEVAEAPITIASAVNTATYKGRTFWLLDNGAVGTCDHCVAVSPNEERTLCRELPNCGGSSLVWMDETAFARWIVETRMT